MISLEELHKQRQLLKDRPFMESVDFLNNIGDYYDQVVPSKISFAFIKETEELLNDLYLRDDKEGSSADLTTNILQALGQVGSLSIAVDQKEFDPEFVILGKQLGKTLKSINNTIY